MMSKIDRNHARMIAVGMATMLVSPLVAGSASAQLLANGPIRVQVGNGPALIGSSTTKSPLGISILSKSLGSTSGTSIRLLGDNKTLGVSTKLTSDPATRTVVNVRTPVDKLLAPVTK